MKLILLIMFILFNLNADEEIIYKSNNFQHSYPWIKSNTLMFCVENESLIAYGKGEYINLYSFNNKCFFDIKLAEKLLDKENNQSFFEKFGRGL